MTDDAWCCSVIPPLHPPPGGVAIHHELSTLLVALAAPVVATVAVVPPVACKPLGADGIRDRNRAPAPKDPAWGDVPIDVHALWFFQESHRRDVPGGARP